MGKCCLDKCHSDSWNLFRTLCLKFHQNRVSNSQDIAALEFLVLVGDVKTYFSVQLKPKLN